MSKATSSIATMLAAIALTLSLCAGAEARPLIGGDGKIHACYRVKGKPRGALRVVKSAKVLCRRGERRVAWAAVVSGAKGEPGPTGSTGAPVGSATTATLEAKIASLTTRVESLEATLKGITNAELVAALANVNALCTQAELLTERSNALLSALGGLSLNGVLTTLGGVLNIPELPEPLAAFSCTA